MSPGQRRTAFFACLLLAVGLIVALYLKARTPTARVAAEVTRPKSSAQPANPVPSAPPSDAPAPAPTDPSFLALDQARRIQDPLARAREFGQQLQALILRDPEAALAYLRRLPRGPEFSQGLLQTLDAISRRDVARALLLARELATTREDRVFYTVLFDRLARENAAGAVERLAAVPPGEARENALRALTDAWMRTDPNAALAWARQLANPADRNIAVESALLELAGRDPRRAIEFAQEALKGPALDRTVSRAIQHLTAADPASAARLVNLLPPGDAQTMAAVDVARALALQNVESALAWAKTLSVEVTQWLAINNVLSVWAQRDPMAVARYVSEMPPGPGLDFIARHAAGLLSVNPRDAILWAESLPSDSAKSAALIMVASTWAQRSPAEAVRWAASLQREPLRTDAITGAHSYWMMQDAASARAWLEKADLPAVTKSKLLRSREVQF